MLIYMWRIANINRPHSWGLERIRVIDTAISKIWTRRYYEPGDFEIFLPADEELFDLLVNEEIFFTRDDDPAVMYAEKIKLTTSAENGDRIIISGRSAESRLDRRVIRSRENLGEVTPEVLAAYLVQRYFTQPVGELADIRKDSLLEIEYPKDFSDMTITGEYFGENVLDVVSAVCRASGNGIKITMNEDETKFIFSLYKGTDRSETVVFSPMFGNLLSTEYERDTKNTFNAAVIYETTDEKDIIAEDYIITKTDVSATMGLVLKEKWIAAQSIPTEGTHTLSLNGGTWRDGCLSGDGYTPYSPGSENYGRDICNAFWTKVKNTIEVHMKLTDGKYAYKWIVKFFNASGEEVSTIERSFGSQSEITTTFEVPGSAETVHFELSNENYSAPELHPSNVEAFEVITDYTLTEDERKEYMSEQARREIAAQERTETFFGEVIDNGLYRFGEDYQLGDIIRLENAYGISATARITEVSQVEDAEGLRITPTFSEITVI